MEVITKPHRDRREYFRQYNASHIARALFLRQEKITTRRSQGLCLSCGGEVATKYNTCEECLVKKRIMAKRHRVAYKEQGKRKRKEGICVSCGKPALPNYASCASCLFKDSLRRKRKRIENPAWAKSEIQRNHRTIQRWVSEGKCCRCGAPLGGDEESKRCFPCQINSHERNIPYKKGVYRETNNKIFA